MNSTPPPQPKKAHGLADLLFDELNDTDKKDASADKGAKPNSFYHMMNEMKSRITMKAESVVEKKHTDIATVIKDYRLYSKLTIHSKIPSIWLNTVWERLQTSPKLGKEVTLADIWAREATKEERMILLAGKMRQCLEYFHYTSPKSTIDNSGVSLGDKPQEAAAKFKSYWNAWQHFTTNQESIFYAMNKQTSICFHQSSEYIRDILQTFNPNLLASLVQIREMEASQTANQQHGGSKSAESKGRLPENTFYAVIGNNRGNHGFIKMVEAAGN